MAKLILLAGCLLVVSTTLEAGPAYTTKYDNVNVDEILKNDKLFNSYFGCIMEKPGATCTPEGAELKSLGLIVLSKAFNTFANMPAELQPVINDLHNTIRNEYVEEIDKFQNFKILPDAIKTECGGCSEKQKEGAQKVMKYLHDNKQDEWNELLNKFDSDGSLREKYKDKANEFFGTSA